MVELDETETDTDGNGRTRFYARWRPMDATVSASFAISVAKPGTYQLAAVQQRRGAPLAADLDQPCRLCGAELGAVTVYRIGAEQ